MSDDYPELAGYEPHDQRPLRGKRRRNIMRFVVVLAVVSLVLPGLLSAFTLANSTAQHACAVRAAQVDHRTGLSEARFEVFGPGLLGWECYQLDPFDGPRHLDSMGLFPSIPSVLAPLRTDRT